MPDTIGEAPKSCIKAVVLAAGRGKRWNNYLGIPKQMISIGGEPLLLRTIRQLKERGFDVIITVPEKDYYGKMPVEQIVGIDDVEIDKLLNVRSYAGAIFLWGDTYFTDEAMDIMTKSKYDFRFFGRSGGSDITGKRWGEIFALKTNRMVLEKAKELKRIIPQHKRCGSWELYRLICGYPLNKHIVKDNFTEINDLTEDFDFPVDYDIWIKNFKLKPVYINEAFRRLHEYNPERILHIGGHTGEEGEIYKSIGAKFTFVEPVPEYAEEMRRKGYDVLEVAIGERGEKKFNVCSIFSSFLKRKKELLDYQQRWLKKSGEIQREIKVKVIPLSDIQEGYDTLVVDTEGTVLEVLKSGHLNFKTIIAEIRKEPAYYGEPPNEEIENYLIKNGYIKDKKYGNNTIFIKKI